jgi:hypothetical protein
MKSVALCLLLFPVLLLAQSQRQLRIKEEIAKHPNGSWLYGRSEVFRKTIEHKLKQLDAPTAQQAQKITGGNYKNVSLDDFGQDETTVAISRTNKNVIVIGSNDEVMDLRSMPSYSTMDGGNSWQTNHIPKVPPPYSALGDPMIIADNESGFYYAHLIKDFNSNLSNILVSYSSNGTSWMYTAPVITKTSTHDAEDKESIAIDRDPASPYYNRLYLSWLHFDSAFYLSGIRIAYSDDSAKTWSKPIVVTQGYRYFSQVKVGKGGKVFLAFSEYSEHGVDDDTTYHYFLSSTDGGETFTTDTLARYFNYPFYLGAGLTLLKGANGFRAIPYISYDIDPISNIIHLVYGDYGYWDHANNKRSSILRYVQSSDEGKTWSSPVAVGYKGDSSSLERDRFQPSLAVDPITGKAYLFYLSSENDTSNLKYQPYLLRLGTSEKPFALTDSMSNPFKTLGTSGDPFIGDYTGLDVYDGYFCAAWTENADLGVKGEIYAFISPNIDSVKSAIKQTKISSSGLSIYPNPGSSKRAIIFDVKHNADVSIQLFDIEGKFVASVLNEYLTEGEHSKEIILPSLASGVYSLVCSQGDVTTSINIVISK